MNDTRIKNVDETSQVCLVRGRGINRAPLNLGRGGTILYLENFGTDGRTGGQHGATRVLIGHGESLGAKSSSRID